MAVEIWGCRPELGVLLLEFVKQFELRVDGDEILPPESSPLARALRTGAATGQTQMEILRPDGNRRHVRVKTEVLRDLDGMPNGALSLFEDVSTHVESDYARKEGERLYRQLLEQLPAAIYTCDAAGKIQLFNDMAVELWGRVPRVGEDLWCGSYRIYRSDGTPLPHEESPVAQVIREGRALEVPPWIVERPDGTRRHVQPYPRPLMDSQGKVIGALNMLVDITQQREAQYQRELLASIVDSSHDAIVSKTLDGRITSWNPAAERLLGYTAEEAIGKSIGMIIPPDRLSEEQGILQRLGRGQRIENYETVRVRKDGQQLHLSLTISPVRDASGNIVGASKVAHDVTEKVRSQQLVRESEARFRLLAGHAPVGIFESDAAGRLVFVNQTWCQLTGLPIEAAREGAWVEAIHHDDREMVLEQWRNSLATASESSLEFRLVRPDGSESWVEWNAKPLRREDQDVTGYIGTVFDITHRKEAEQTVRRNEARFRSMADTAPAMLWMTDNDNNCTFLSQAWSDYTALAEADGLGDGWLRVIHPEDRESAVQTMQSAAQHVQAFSADYRMRRADGQYRWVVNSGRPRFDQEGNREGYIGAVIDVHARRETEQQLRIAMEAADQANRSKSEFLANMSHEIRTPMTAILGYADILRENLRDPDNVQCINIVRQNGQFLLEIINDILDISKIEAGKLDVVRTRVSPAELIFDIHSLMNVRAQEKRIPLRVIFEGPLPATIETDPTRFRQILLNLIGNAVKFTDHGHVHVVTRLLAKEEMLEVDVVDTGVGIDPAQLSILFQPFSQADTSATRSHGGTGLGLAISKRLANALGGDIYVKSQKNAGSVFTLRIATGPLRGVEIRTPDAQGPGEGGAAGEDQPNLHCRVLVVDDRRDVRYIAQHFLEEAGAQVWTAENGGEAFHMLMREQLAQRIDVVVMDIQMPVMDGYATAMQLRAAGFDRPMIALTANAMQGDRDKCLSAGFDNYLPKPLDSRLLIEMVNQVMRSKR